jgi:hypothetical protein
MKNKIFSILGAAAVLLALVVLAGCPTDNNGGGGNGGGTSFDGSTLNGTTWKLTETRDMADDKDDVEEGVLSVDVTITEQFTSATAGTQTATTSNWSSGFSTQQGLMLKQIVEYAIAGSTDSFTYTYDAVEHTGTITTTTSEETSDFTVNVSAKTITIVSEENGTKILTLQ